MRRLKSEEEGLQQNEEIAKDGSDTLFVLQQHEIALQGKVLRHAKGLAIFTVFRSGVHLSIHYRFLVQPLQSQVVRYP